MLFRSPPVVVEVGTGDSLLLTGTVLSFDTSEDHGVVYEDGEVLVTGDIIVCVGEAGACAVHGEAYETATLIHTDGVISPGLVDAHNHMNYNVFDEWVPDPPRCFGHRSEWADDPTYEAHIEPYTVHRSRNTHFCPTAKYAEIRSLINGTTTLQGDRSDGRGRALQWSRPLGTRSGVLLGPGEEIGRASCRERV